MTTVAEYTASEKILLSANRLEEKGQSPFSAENLIVAAWKDYPRTFGLKGYDEQFPDSNRVLSCIMGEKGLTKRGWLAKMGQKLYSLTREGRQMVRRLQGGVEPEIAEPVRSPHGPGQKLSRDLEKYLQAILASAAVKKFQEGQKEEVTWPEACQFWGITDKMFGDALNSRLNRVLTALAELKELVGPRGIELSNGRHVTLDDLLAIGDLHEYLESRFTRHLNLLRNRATRS